KFVFRFEFKPDDQVSVSDGRFEPRSGDAVSAEPPAPSLNGALEAIGLKLEKAKGPRGYLVIDAIERPSPDAPMIAPAPPARAAPDPDTGNDAQRTRAIVSSAARKNERRAMNSCLDMRRDVPVQSVP